jgi:phosphohistidine phosphatase SixA
MIVRCCAAILAAILLAARPVPASAEGPAAAPKYVYVMRHLQKAPGDDPPLTEEGAALAEMVAAMLGFDGFGVKAVFATPTRRAMQTGQPLAAFIKVPVTPYDPKNVPALVAAVNAVPGSVLVVGHSNTVPDLVAAFGGARPKPLTEQDYGTIYQVTVGSGNVREFYVPPPPIPLKAGQERGR